MRGLHDIFNQGKLAIIQRTGYPNQSRSHFLGTDIWSTAYPANSQGPGWLGRYLDLLPSPVDPLTAWNTQRETPRTLLSRTVGVPVHRQSRGVPVSESEYRRRGDARADGGHAHRVARAGRSAASGVRQQHRRSRPSPRSIASRRSPRTSSTATTPGGVTYPNNGFAQALKAIAGSIVRGVGTKVFWCQTGGFDTHSGQSTNVRAGPTYNLMATLNDGLAAFYNDLKNQGLLDQTLILQFSEFGRRVAENGTGNTAGTDHGAGSVMMAIGGKVNGGLFGTAPNLNNTDSANIAAGGTLENNGNDVRFETDFRSVYARVIDNWLGADSVSLLGGDFRKTSLIFCKSIAGRRRSLLASSCALEASQVDRFTTSLPLLSASLRSSVSRLSTVEMFRARMSLLLGGPRPAGCHRPGRALRIRPRIG